MSKPLIFVCSPFRANAARGLAAHIAYAKRACRAVIECGGLPFAPHLLYPSFLNDNLEAERQLGMEAGIEILAACDEVWVFEDYGISNGMLKEIQEAHSRTIIVQYRTILPLPEEAAYLKNEPANEPAPPETAD